MLALQLVLIGNGGVRTIVRTLKMHVLTLTSLLRYAKNRAKHEKVDHVIVVLMNGEMVAEYGGIL